MLSVNHLLIQREFEMAGYSNDIMGYIPSPRVLKEGGYEGGGAMLYTAHPGPWSDKVEDTIIGAVMRLERKLSDM